MKRPALAIVLLAIGVFMLLEGSYLSSGSIVVDLGLVAVGTLLTISYLPLMGNYLEKKFNAKSSVTYMPILAMLGVGLLWQAVSRILAIIDKAVFAIVGAALLLGSTFFIYRAKKSK